jgi:hypothetical protein
VVKSGGLANEVRPVAGDEEVGGEALEEGDAVAAHPVLKLPDGRVVEPALAVVLALVEVGRHGGGQHGLRHALGAVPGDVAGDLAASHREAHQRRGTQIQVGHERVEVRREGVVVVAVPRLG